MKQKFKKIHFHLTCKMILFCFVMQGAYKPIVAQNNIVSFKYNEFNTLNGHTRIADMNSDGKKDLAVQNESYIGWYKYPDFEPFYIKKDTFFGDRFDLTDIDGDGDTDFVVGKFVTDSKTNKKLGYVVWYENPLPKKDAETGSNWIEHPIGIMNGHEKDNYIKDLSVGDINGDGKPDIVSRTQVYATVFFQPTKKTNKLWETNQVNVVKSEGLAIADIDLDGNEDLVLNGFWCETPDDYLHGEFIKHTIHDKWFTQDNGKWVDNKSYVTVGDINSDGLTDVIISHAEKINYPICWYSVNSIEDTKKEVWEEHVVAIQFDWAETLAAKDVDNDGDIDIMSAKFPRQWGGSAEYRNEAPFPVTVLYNKDGKGESWQSQQVSLDGIYDGTLGDLGSDGDIDIAGPRSYWIGPVKVWENQSNQKKQAINKWQYIMADNTRTRYPGKAGGGGGWFGLDMADVTGDGYKDIVSGHWFYKNPGTTMTSHWERVSFGTALQDSVDGLLFINADDDDLADIFAVKGGNQYWFEALDKNGYQWKHHMIGNLPLADHGRSIQAYSYAQLIPGGKPEIIASDKGVYCIEIPENPEQGLWKATHFIKEGEAYCVSDMDADGWNDIVGYHKVEGKGEVPGSIEGNWNNNVVVWWKNPGSIEDKWVRNEIGLATTVERIIAKDLNNDGFVDVAVSEERYPGREPNANLQWFKNPGKTGSNWERQVIFTSYSMNNLDVADMDKDGDWDLVTGEHKGPREKLLLFENDGTGNFTKHVLDEGKESHLGTKLADMDLDGDLDIVSIAWEDFQYVHLWRNDAINIYPVSKKQPYSFEVEVNSGEAERQDFIAEFEINFTNELKKHKVNKALDVNSLYVEEISASGYTTSSSVDFQFDKSPDFDAETNANGTIIVWLKGTTSPNAIRRLNIYFDCIGKEYVTTDYTDYVQLHIDDVDEGHECFRITAQNGEYTFDKLGGGFTSLRDLSRVDWIDYHQGNKFEGEYRGIPNIAPPGFHPGTHDNHKESIIVNQGPLKVSIKSETIDEQWATLWEIYPHYAKMTITNKSDKPYWFLYEGTPGGTLDTTDYWVTSDGTKYDADSILLEKALRKDLPDPEWVYFTDENTPRVLFLHNHQDDELVDEYWSKGAGSMTVFGFGRGPRDGGWQYLNYDKAVFTIGFIESKNDNTIKKAINSIYMPYKMLIKE